MTHLELIDRLDHYSIMSTKLLSIVMLIWAIIKVCVVANSIGILAALSVASIHLPFCAFGTLFTVLMIDRHFKIGYAAMVFAILNSLLI